LIVHFIYLTCLSLLEQSLTVDHTRCPRPSVATRTSIRDSDHERQRLNEGSTSQHESEQQQSSYENEILLEHRSTACYRSKSTSSMNPYVARHSDSRISTTNICHDFTSGTTANGTHHRQTISQRTTKMLVICSTTFLVFNSPYCAVLLYSVISKDVLTRILSILRHFYFMSFCLNFFLYSLCGHRFRRELILLFNDCVRKCCSNTNRSHRLRIDKIPTHSSFTRAPTRTAVWISPAMLLLFLLFCFFRLSFFSTKTSDEERTTTIDVYLNMCLFLCFSLSCTCNK
jgi:hypothetical protein